MTEPLVLAMPPVYARATPFEFVFSGAQGESVSVWEPENMVFELAGVIVRSVIPMDLNICDTNPAIPVMFMQTLAGVYTSQFLGMSRVRGVWSPNSKLLLMDPVGVATRVKGMVYGWEVSREGVYR